MSLDFRNAVRRLLHHPLPSIASILIIAIGIATITPLFSITDALLLKPLPFREPDRLVEISAPFEFNRRLKPDERLNAREQLEASPLQDGVGFATPGLLFDSAARSANDVPLVEMEISPNLFDLLGVQPSLGQGVAARSVVDQAPLPQIFIAHDVWRTRFGTDASLVGAVVELGDQTVQVLGVMAPDFHFPHGANVWTVKRSRPASAIPNYARLSGAATIQHLRDQFPRLTIVPLREATTPRGAATVAYLLMTTSLVLIIAWVQVAALQLSRAAGRAREVGVQLALGATPSRLLRGFLAEGLVLAGMALGLSWLVTPAMTAAIVHLLPPEMTRAHSVSTDWRTFGFACGVSAIGVVLFALLPMRVIGQSTPASALRGNGFSAIRLSAGRTRMAMLIVQLAVTSTLLYRTALSVHSLWRIDSVDLGFEPSAVIALHLPVQPKSGDVLEAVRGMSNVDSAATAYGYPSQRGAMRGTARLPANASVDPMSVRVNYVSPGFFATLRIPLLEGRMPEITPSSDVEPEVLVNRAFARRVMQTGDVPTSEFK